MRFAQTPDELRHIATNALRLRTYARVRVLYADYVSLEGTVLATHHRRNEREPLAPALSFTIRTDDERELEVDVLDVRTIHSLDA